MSENIKVVVIGGVACGPKAAARIKRLNPAAEVTIIERGSLISYAGCGLPFYISGEVPDPDELMATPTGVVRDPHFFKAVKGVAVYANVNAESVDRSRKVVHAVRQDSGERLEFPYDALVLSVGSRYIVPPIDGTDLKGVHFLQTIEDAQKIRHLSGALKGKNAVVIGAGLIGIEATEALKMQGMNITIVERLDTVLGQMLDPEIAFHLHNELRANGVGLRLGETVLRINGDREGVVRSVVTDTGEIAADIVLIAVGVRPNTRLAREMGLELGATGAIKVDARMRTSDPDIYAGGDCVENTSLVTGKPIYAPMGSTANKHGRVIADNICGIPTEFNGVLGTCICKVFGTSVARTGLTEQQAKAEGRDCITVLNPSPDKPHFMKDARLIIIKFIVDRATRKLIGAQMVGPGDVAKRMEVAAANMISGNPVTAISQYDLAYAPPFSPAMDNIITTANIAENKLNGFGCSCTPFEVREKLQNGDDFILLDVRSPQEYEQMRIEDPRVRLIPLGMLRTRMDELPKDQEIIPFCKISLRGYEAERILTGEGYENVKYMDGGIVCWPFEKVVRPSA